MLTKYQKIGLRADRNLTDLDDRSTALRNMLTDLNVDDLGFTPNDLLVISGLRNTPVTSDDLIQAAGENTLVTYTPLDGGDNENVRPLVRIIDRIENYKVITGTPPFANGGDGPNAWFIPSKDLANYSSLSQSSTGSDVVLTRTGSDTIGPIDFWDNGTFTFGLKVNDEFEDSYGGVQWEGWTALTRFTIDTTGTYMIEYDPYGEGWETVRSVYAEDRTVSYLSSSVVDGKTQVVLDEDQHRFVNIGDFVLVNGQRVLVENIESDTLTFEGEVSSISSGGGSLTLSFAMSEDPVRSPEIRLRDTYVGDKFKMRITVWWNNRGDNDRLPVKSFEFYDVDSERYPFSYFYKEYTRGLEPVRYTYEHFAKYKASPLAQYSTAPLQSSETIAVQYIPPVNVSTKRKVASRTFTFDGIGKFLGDTSNIEVGDYLVDGTNASQVFQIYYSEDQLWVDPIVLEGNYPSLAVGDEVTFDIVSHLGLIDIYPVTNGTGLQAQVGSGMITSNLFDARADHLVAGNDNSLFKRVTLANESPNIIKSVAIHGDSEVFNNSTYLLVYASSGLVDLSAEVQCVGVFGKEATAQSGTNTITVSDTNGVQTGQYVQFLTGTSATNRLDTGTTVSSINGNVITLNKNVIGTIEAGATIVFSNTNDNKEYCVLPLNTAPPFSGTADGLSTTASNPNIKFNGVSFSNLLLNNTTVAVNSDFSYSEYIDVTHNGTSYKMLIK
jgi:hypothetical protein